MMMTLTVLLAAAAVTSGKEQTMSLHELTVNTIDLKPQPLADFKGKVLLVVNTASECGNTPQYAGLEKLYEEYKGRGLVVLGFPSNDFGGQEPGSEAEIKTFCSTRYKVSFPLFQKVKTKGEGQSAVYQFLTRKHEPPEWNFHKYLVGKDGQVLRSFKARTPPEDKDLREAIETALR